MQNEALARDAKKRTALIEERCANIFLEAGAGAGKSTLMVDRIVHQIVIGNQKIGDIVAITFTEKAATELEEKIAKRLDAELVNLQQDASKKAICDEIEANRDALFIGTIHSFCQKIIKERPLESGIPIRFDLVDEEAEQNKRKQFFYKQIHQPTRDMSMLFSYLEKFEMTIYDFYDLFDAQVTNKALGIDNAFCAVDKTFEQVDEAIEARSYLLDEMIHVPLKPICIREALAKSYVDEKSGDVDFEKVASMMQQIEKIVEKRKTVYKNFKEQIAVQLEKIKDAYSGELTPAFKALFDELLPTYAVESSVVDIFDKDTAALMKEKKTHQLQLLFAKLHDGSEKFASNMKSNADLPLLHRNLLGWIERFVCFDELDSVNATVQTLLDTWATQYVAANKIKGELTFDDLLLNAYKVLQNEPARAFFHQKFRHLYVDEVQDTDPLQMKILFLLAAASRPSSWIQADIAPNRLFLVGDPKQSIYRFRNADLRIYDKVKQLAQASPNWLYEELTINFRSNARLINWFNGKFEPMFGLEMDTSIQPSFVQMEARTTDEDVDGLEHGVKFYELQQAAFLNGRKDEFCQKEAEKISLWIQHNVGTLQIYDQPGKTHAMCYRDVLIILPKTTKMNEYLHVLHAAGIPTSFSGKISIGNFKEIHRLMALVHYVANPSKATLLAAHLICQQATLTETFALQDDKDYAALEQLAVLSPFVKLKDMAATMSPLGFLEYVVYNEPRIVVGEACTKLQYNTALSILTTFVEKIRPMPFVSYKQMSNEFKRFLQDDYKLEYEMSITHDGDAVRLMNLHKSKGLEAPVVFLAGVSTFKNDDFVVHIDREQEPREQAHYGLYKKYDYSKTLLYTPQALKTFEPVMRKHESAEFIRLLYVAATRAKQLLFIGLKQGEEKLAALNASWMSLYGESDAATVFAWDDLGLQAQEQDDRQYKVTVKKQSSVVADKTYDEVSPSTLEKGRVRNTEALEETALYEEQMAELKQLQQFKGSLWGSMVHQLFELHMLERKNPADYDAHFYTIAITRGLLQYDLTVKELATFNMGEELGQHRNARLAQLVGNDTIRSALKHELQQLAANNELNALLAKGTIYPEMLFKKKIHHEAHALYTSFHSQEGAVQDVPLYVSGIIDLAIVSDDGVYLVDYKTNSIQDEQCVEAFHERLRSTYARQMKAYAAIAGEIFGVKVAGVYLYATATNRLIACDWS